jgi:hypothetical protein
MKKILLTRHAVLRLFRVTKANNNKQIVNYLGQETRVERATHQGYFSCSSVATRQRRRCVDQTFSVAFLQQSINASARVRHQC